MLLAGTWYTFFFNAIMLNEMVRLCTFVEGYGYCEHVCFSYPTSRCHEIRQPTTKQKSVKVQER